MLRQSFWALAAVLGFACMAAVVKLSNNTFGPLELVFYRSLITTVFVFLTTQMKGQSLRTTHLKEHLIRDFSGLVSVCIWFFTLGLLPLGTNITLTYTTALFLAANFIILSLVKHLPVPKGAIFAILLGFSGIVIIMRPSFTSGEEIPALLCLCVAAIDLFVYWRVRKLGNLGEPSWRIVFYFSLISMISTFFGVLLFENGFTQPNLESGALLVLMGTFATVGMLCSTKAWVGGNMLLVSCLGFTAIPVSEIISILFFKNEPSIYTISGMILILVAGVLSTIFNKREEQNIARIEGKTK